MRCRNRMNGLVCMLALSISSILCVGAITSLNTLLILSPAPIIGALISCTLGLFVAQTIFCVDSYLNYRYESNPFYLK